MINTQDIRWVANSRTKPLEDELNLLLAKRKCDYPKRGTVVKLTQIKDEYPNADIRFSTMDKGNCEGLCYLHYNKQGQYVKDANGDWIWISSKTKQDIYEGYQHSITNTYGMTDKGLWDLAETLNYVKKVLIERILGKG